MPTITPKLGLNKPANNEAYNISKVTNENADILDEKVLINPILNKEIPIDTDSIVLIDSEDTNKSKKFSWLNIKSYLQEKLISGTNIKTINGNPILGSGDLVIATSSDWNLINATLTYASSDSPTFVANTSIDLTSVISVGMKLKLTQTTVKYFIVTAITSTTITLYGGTDYTLANATITLPYFSSMKAPFGFPLNPDKWSIIATATSLQAISNPVLNQWYELTNGNISIPIGLWNVYYQIQIYAANATETNIRARSTLSTTNNSETIASFTRKTEVLGKAFSQTHYAMYSYLERVTKATYYLLIQAPTASYANLNNDAGSMPLIIKAVCAYL